MKKTASQGEVETHTETDPDESILCVEGYTEKVGNTLINNIRDGYFYNNVQVSRRTPKNKQLKNELFDDTIYTQNQCGFTSSRPLLTQLIRTLIVVTMYLESFS